MWVTITPADSPAVLRNVDCTFTTANPGGYKEARIQFPDALAYQEKLLDAKVLIFDAKGVCWMGNVWSWTANEVTAAGAQSRLALQVGEYDYCKTGLSDWQPHTATYEEQNIEVQADTNDVLRFVYSDGTSFAADRTRGAVCKTTASGIVRLAFTWTRPTTNFAIYAYSGSAMAVTGSGEQYNWVSQWSQNHGSGDLTGSADITMNVSGNCAVMIAVHNSGTFTSCATSHVSVTNLKLYNVSGVCTSSGTSLTVTNVVTHLLGLLPTTDLPASTTDWIATDSTVVQPFTSEGPQRLDTILASVMDYTDYDFRFEAKELDGAWYACPVLEARSTTPDYFAYLDGDRVSSDLAGWSMEGLCSQVWVNYKTAEGDDAHVLVTDVDTTHRLVALGRTKTEMITVDTTSASAATSAGEKYLTEAGRTQLTGTISIQGTIHDINGAEVLPSRIIPGKMLRLTGGNFGSVDARITEVSCTGDLSCSVTVDNTPDIPLMIARATSARSSGMTKTKPKMTQ